MVNESKLLSAEELKREKRKKQLAAIKASNEMLEQAKATVLKTDKLGDVERTERVQEIDNAIRENEQRAKNETQDAAMKAVCENVKLDIPSGMIAMETENMLKDIEQRLSYQGLKLEQYLQMVGKTKEEMLKEYEPQAIEAIKSRLTLEAIIKAEKIEATEEEINEKIKEMAENYGKKEEEIKDNENLKKYLKESIETEKAIEFIVKNAKIK